jgi:hypothetical protein
MRTPSLPGPFNAPLGLSSPDFGPWDFVDNTYFDADAAFAAVAQLELEILGPPRKCSTTSDLCCTCGIFCTCAIGTD